MDCPRSYFSPYKNVENLTAGPDGEFLTGRLASESIDFLGQAAKTPDPFLLYLSFYSVHTPLQAPKHLVEKYEAKAKKMNIAGEDGSFDVGGERQVWRDAKDQRKVRIRQDHAVYAAMVESLDTAIGRVLQKLEQLNLRDNTAIIFMSDNGGLSTSEGHPTSNLPLRGGKGWMYEGGIREPVVVRWPGVTASGTRCSMPAVSTDFYPTILEMAGLEAKPDQHVDGGQHCAAAAKPFREIRPRTDFLSLSSLCQSGWFPGKRSSQRRLQTDPGSRRRSLRAVSNSLPI